MEKHISLIINSADRIVPSDTNIDFRVQPYPRNALIKSYELEYVNLPFSFKNVTSTYGNTLNIRVPAATIPILTITIPNYFYTIPQLITYLNSVLGNNVFQIPHPPGSPIDVLLSFSVSPQNNYLQLNAVVTAPVGVSVSFGVSFPLLTIPKTQHYIWTMLGLSTDTANPTIIAFSPSLGYSATLPFSFTQDIPFKYVLINFDDIPSGVFTTKGITAGFFVDVSNYRPVLSLSSSSIVDSKTIQYYPNTSFYQVLEMYQNFYKLNSMRIRLLDDNNNDISEHTEQRDWSLSLKVTYIE